LVEQNVITASRETWTWSSSH